MGLDSGTSKIHIQQFDEQEHRYTTKKDYRVERSESR
jgi:hypothetical protein